MENDSPNLFDSEPISVNLAFPESTGDDDVLTEILEEIREDDRKPSVIENANQKTDSNVDEPPVDNIEYHTDDSDDENDLPADDLPVDADLDQSTELQKENSPNAKTKDIHKGLPPGRVKLIMKMDPDVNIVAGDAVFLLTKATEQFVGLLAQHSHKVMVATNKKTLQKKHIDTVIEDSVPFEFLEGALDW
ncbi:DNA polymerase epsilon subunit 4-like [Aphis craccivora]|uniref:DNA polymerase epsilon subunit 4-like n=1 Tax=Aphis craccivora TaxID=307492 RepID=A0A6G0ZQC7_APHCR|nr:DNA polymerase epsilon subunit 4-like [Aphis craccivora]